MILRLLFLNAMSLRSLHISRSVVRATFCLHCLIKNFAISCHVLKTLSMTTMGLRMSPNKSEWEGSAEMWFGEGAKTRAVA